MLTVALIIFTLVFAFGLQRFMKYLESREYDREIARLTALYKLNNKERRQ